MSRHSISRSAKREKQKTLRALIALGLTSSAFAAVAGVLVWSWSPGAGNWTLSPQQDFAESGKSPGRSNGQAWVPPEVPPVTPWATLPTSADTVASNQSPDETTTQIASVETKDGTSAGHGPIGYGSQSDGDGNVDHTLGLFDSIGSGNPIGTGGQGNTWNGTLHPNTSGLDPLGATFPSLTTPANGGNQPTCESGKVWNGKACVPAPQQLTAPTPNDDSTQHDCGTGQHWDAGAKACVANEQSTSAGDPPSCSTGQHWNADAKACVANDQSTSAGDPPSCGTGQHWNADAKACVANEQTDPDPQTCGTGEHWDNALAICVANDQTNTGNTGGAGGQLLINDPLATIPEPGSLLMFSVALLGLGWFVRRRA